MAVQLTQGIGAKRVYEHRVDDWIVTSNLSPADVAAMRNPRAFLLRIVRQGYGRRVA